MGLKCFYFFITLFLIFELVIAFLNGIPLSVIKEDFYNCLCYFGAPSCTSLNLSKNTSSIQVMVFHLIPLLDSGLLISIVFLTVIHTRCCQKWSGIDRKTRQNNLSIIRNYLVAICISVLVITLACSVAISNGFSSDSPRVVTTRFIIFCLLIFSPSVRGNPLNTVYFNLMDFVAEFLIFMKIVCYVVTLGSVVEVMLTIDSSRPDIILNAFAILFIIYSVIFLVFLLIHKTIELKSMFQHAQHSIINRVTIFVFVLFVVVLGVIEFIMFLLYLATINHGRSVQLLLLLIFAIFVSVGNVVLHGTYNKEKVEQEKLN